MTVAINLLPDHPFTTADADEIGLHRDVRRRLVREGHLRHPMRGVYVAARLPDTVDLRAQCAALALPPQTVVADRSAAWLHGIDILDFAELGEPPQLEVVSVGGADRTRAAGTLGGKRDLRSDEIVMVHGVPVTSPLRTACDIACLRGRLRALATLDAFRRRFKLTIGDFLDMLPRYAGRRGVTQLREMVPRSSPDAESQPESWCRGIILDEQFPAPTPQVWVLLPDGCRVRVENAWEHLRIAVEYDGEEFHTETSDRVHDAERREALRRAGWIIIVVRKDGFSGPGREAWVAELTQAMAARQPAPQGKRLYARGPDNPAYRRRRRRTR